MAIKLNKMCFIYESFLPKDATFIGGSI